MVTEPTPDGLIRGELVRLRPAVAADMATLVAIRSTPEVYATWRGENHEEEFWQALASKSLHYLVIEDLEGTTIGAIQWEAEEDPEYRHAGVDIYIDPTRHNGGLGTDAVRTLCRHLVRVEGHHRVTIDPAADNHAAIRAYEKAGFKTVGVMRRYERRADGAWHDGLLMDLLAEDIVD